MSISTVSPIRFIHQIVFGKLWIDVMYLLLIFRPRNRHWQRKTTRRSINVDESIEFSTSVTFIESNDDFVETNVQISRTSLIVIVGYFSNHSSRYSRFLSSRYFCSTKMENFHFLFINSSRSISQRCSIDPKYFYIRPEDQHV